MQTYTSTEVLIKQNLAARKMLKGLQSKPPVPKVSLRAKSKLKSRYGDNKSPMKTRARGMTPMKVSEYGATTDNTKRSSFGSNFQRAGQMKQVQLASYFKKAALTSNVRTRNVSSALQLLKPCASASVFLNAVGCDVISSPATVFKTQINLIPEPAVKTNLKVSKDDGDVIAPVSSELRIIQNSLDLLFEFENREYLLSQVEQKER